MDYPRLSVLFRHTSKNNQLVTLQIPYLKGAGGQLTQNSPVAQRLKPKDWSRVVSRISNISTQQVGLSSAEVDETGISCSREVQPARQELGTE